MTETNGAQREAAREEGILGTLLELPWVGSWIALVLLVLPAVPLYWIFSAMGLGSALEDGGGQFGRGDWFVMAVLGGATLIWLRLLKRTKGITLTFYYLSCIWLAWAFTGVSVLGLIFGFE